MEKCKFYLLDTEAKKEFEEMEALHSGGMSEEERKAWEELEASLVTENDPFAKCGAFCKHCSSGNGYPGEHVYFCKAPGNEHIIHCDFNESEII